MENMKEFAILHMSQSLCIMGTPIRTNTLFMGCEKNGIKINVYHIRPN